MLTTDHSQQVSMVCGAKVCVWGGRSVCACVRAYLKETGRADSHCSQQSLTTRMKYCGGTGSVMGTVKVSVCSSSAKLHGHGSGSGRATCQQGSCTDGHCDLNWGDHAVASLPGNFPSAQSAEHVMTCRSWKSAAQKASADSTFALCLCGQHFYKSISKLPNPADFNLLIMPLQRHGPFMRLRHHERRGNKMMAVSTIITHASAATCTQKRCNL
eukprot:1160128-Pelagomonas_calceolata.AAC.4